MPGGGLGGPGAPGGGLKGGPPPGGPSSSGCGGSPLKEGRGILPSPPEGESGGRP